MKEVKKILEGYRWANIEVERMEKRRRRLAKQEDQREVDSVRGSMKEYPYIERVVKIEGDRRAVVAEIDQAIERGLRAKKEAEAIIDQADDPREREILRSRFIDCLSWEEVGERNFVDKRQAQRIVQRFIEKKKQN